jgi:hypothetical protein
MTLLKRRAHQSIFKREDQRPKMLKFFISKPRIRAGQRMQSEFVFGLRRCLVDATLTFRERCFKKNRRSML